ncbi:MAG: alpha/beta fold hydrolase [Arenimonas sp.]|nr:alpha/beta fold hydrolase [Arenimonas sp.]
MNFPDYPFTPKDFTHPNGLRQSYLDEGPRDGEVVVMLHGNPSWSYYWRKLVLGLRDNYRCIVPDHIGMGLSEKPDDANYEYTLQSRVDDLNRLLDSLNLGDNITLAVHDWGGMIGFGWALGRSERVKRLVVLNTSSFPLPAGKLMPWQLKLGRDSKFGALLIRGFNAFADGATRFGVVNKMPAAVRDAYNAPYDSWANRISTLRFVQDIPLSPADRAWALVEAAGKKLPEYAERPVFIGWGLQDFVFDRNFLEGFQRALPNAEQHIFADAGHYVLEDKADELVPAIRSFLDRHPL